MNKIMFTKEKEKWNETKVVINLGWWVTISQKVSGASYPSFFSKILIIISRIFIINNYYILIINISSMYNYYIREWLILIY